MVAVVENGEICLCVDNTEELTSPKNASQVSLVCRAEGQHEMPRVIWTLRPGEELPEAMLVCDMFFFL